MKNNEGKRKFGVLILTHKRADKVVTVKTLRRSGYTGDIYFVVDNEDTMINEYREKYGEKVIVFDKKVVAEKTDEGDNFENRCSIIYARNESFRIAKDIGLDYFIQLDDDYTQFSFRFNKDKVFKNGPIKNLDRIFELMCKLYDRTGALTVAMAQGGDFVGGGFGESVMVKRKAMNSFICSTKKPFKFTGRLNEDVNTYCSMGRRGELFFTPNIIALNQKQTQKTSGGMSQMYKETGTYVKSFYTVMYCPSCVKIGLMGNKNKRLHHKINWDDCVPKILSENA